MGRQLRRFSCSKTYHVIIKGIDDQNIFYEDNDRNFFLKQILITKKEYNYSVYSYCLMGNHVHMVIKIEDEFLSKAIQSLLVRYVKYFNQKYLRKGPLVQNRFKSKNVENLEYFLEVCRYVHRNPEKAGIALTQNYKWSSYHEYLEQNCSENFNSLNSNFLKSNKKSAKSINKNIKNPDEDLFQKLNKKSKKEQIVDKNVLLHYFNNNINDFIDYTTKTIDIDDMNEYVEFEILQRLSDEDLSNIVMKKFDIGDINGISRFFNNMQEKELKEAIEKIKCIKGARKKQVSRLFKIGRRMLEKFW